MLGKIMDKKTIRNTGKARSSDTKVVKIRSEHNGIGVFKTLFVAFLLLLQVAIYVCLYAYFIALFRWYLIVSFVLSLITCIYVISTDKNDQSKAVWIIFLLLGFCFGYIVYFLSDEHVFFGRAKKKYKKIFEDSKKYIPQTVVPDSKSVRNSCSYLMNTGEFPAFSKTAIKYFPSGARLFDNVLARIESARQFIFIEYFIISDGVLLERIMSVLESKAIQGVDVRIIYDDMGCNGVLSRKTKKRMARAGIKLHAFNRLLTYFSVALNFRDHRKMIIVDGKSVYTGGSNMADEYINEKRMYGYWKDTGLRMDGAAVDSFTVMFLRQWEYVSKQNTEYSPYLGHYEECDNSSTVVPYADGLDYKANIGKCNYANVIADAKDKLYIMTPYFIPDSTITELLVNQAQSGVDVRIVLPGIPDKQLIYAVSRGNAERLIESGVKVYCMKNAFVHSKVMLNENCAVVGSINIDLRSFYQQFECAVLTDDKGILSDVNADFENTFSDCEQITVLNAKRKNILNRIYVGALRLFAPLM